MDIVPQHPHLRAVTLSTREMVMHEFPFGKNPSEILSGGVTQARERLAIEREGTAQDTGMVNGIH
jgi:hypothetical protein